jgi:hypothetical protein
LTGCGIVSRPRLTLWSGPKSCSALLLNGGVWFNASPGARSCTLCRIAHRSDPGRFAPGRSGRLRASSGAPVPFFPCL